MNHGPRLSALTLAALIAAPAFAQTDLRDEIFYHFMPIAWRDSDNDASRFGDFDGMTDAIPYLQQLGVTSVWMNPIHPSPAYHGYQHGRGDEVNPWFGTEQDFTDYVTASNTGGIGVYIDFVVYGISHDSPWYQSAFGNPASPYDDWLAFENSPNTQYLGSLYNSWNGNSVGHIHWDLRTQQTADMVTSWCQKWLDPNTDGDFADGISGFRLDHVWVQYVNGPDGWGYNLDDFWTPWKAALQSVNPDVITFAEQADWGSFGAEFLPVFDAAFTNSAPSSCRSSTRRSPSRSSSPPATRCATSRPRRSTARWRPPSSRSATSRARSCAPSATTTSTGSARRSAPTRRVPRAGPRPQPPC